MVSGQAQAIFGREAERRALAEALALAERGPVVVLCEGDPGIGKTTLWRAALGDATGRGQRVLRCHPIEAEVQLAHAALGDLLADVPDTAFEALPGPQRRALEVALLRVEPGDEPVATRAVAMGLLGVLVHLSTEQPVVVGIDDGQWLDAPSARALSYAVRRLADERIGVLVARRRGDGGFPLDVARDLPSPLVRVPVGPLARGPLDDLLRDRLVVPLGARALERLHGVADGNPYFALELGAALAEQERTGRHLTDLPVPDSLRAIVGERLERLDPPTREVVGLAATAARPTVALLERLVGAEPAAAALDAAVAAEVLDEHAGRIRFVQPLLAELAGFDVSAQEQRARHARLAVAVDDLEERARHLALATEGPDAEAAATLDVAVRGGAGPGAPELAADLLEHARRLTPPEDAELARRRGLEAAERHVEAGDTGRTRRLLDELVAEAEPGRARAEALARLGWIRAHTEGFRMGVQTFRAALAEEDDDPALRVELHGALAWCLHSTDGVAAAEPHARIALETAEASGDPLLLSGALSHTAFLAACAGRPDARATIERAVGLGLPEWSQILGRADWIHALVLMWAGELDEARNLLARLHQRATERGDEHALPFILFQLARVELLTGSWAAARAHARGCNEAARLGGLASEGPYGSTIVALVEAHLGAVEAATAAIDEGIAHARRTGAGPAALEMLTTRGFLELSRGEPAAADRTLAVAAALARDLGLREPATTRFHADALEAKVAIGQLAEAQEVLEELEAWSASGHRWASMVVVRARGLVLGARGDLDGARATLEEGLAAGRWTEPFEEARTQLVLGTVRRRARQKAAAREALLAARYTFASLGARLWLERTSDELARVTGAGAEPLVHPGGDDLTPTERRVAELIAAGRTYREAADALFISPKTVQWNLSKVYRKLGIRSRAELAVRLPASGGAATDPG